MFVKVNFPDPLPLPSPPTFLPPLRSRGRCRLSALSLSLLAVDGSLSRVLSFYIVFVLIVVSVWMCIVCVEILCRSKCCALRPMVRPQARVRVVYKIRWCALRPMVRPQAGVRVIFKNRRCALRPMVRPQARVRVFCKAQWCALRQLVCPQAWGVGPKTSPIALSSWLPDVTKWSSSCSPC